MDGTPQVSFRFSVAFIVPSDFIVGIGSLDKLLSLRMLRLAEGLGVAVDDDSFLPYIVIDSATTWARCPIIRIDVAILF